MLLAPSVEHSEQGQAWDSLLSIHRQLILATAEYPAVWGWDSGASRKGQEMKAHHNKKTFLLSVRHSNP
jgi:hypothetical protein